AHRHRRLHAVDEVDVAHAFLVDDVRRPLPPCRVDVVDIAIGRLGDVGVGGNRAPIHAVAPAYGVSPGQKGRQSPSAAASHRGTPVSAGGGGRNGSHRVGQPAPPTPAAHSG